MLKAVLLSLGVVSAALASNAAQAAIVDVEHVRVYRGGSFADWLAGNPSTVILDDAMNNGNPFTGPNFSNATPSNYSAINLANPANVGLAYSESAGRLHLNADYATATQNAQGGGAARSLGLRLLTNVSDPNRGLSKTDTFAAGALFAFNEPAAGYQYGVRLGDGFSNSNDVIDLRVVNNGNGAFLSFRHQDFAAGTITDFASSQFVVPNGGVYLALGFAHEVANSNVIHGYWGFTDANGVLLGNVNQLGETAIFNGEGHTRFELRAIAPVPEAETYAMLLAGLGLIGAAARRKSK
jgi:hypothetical protein